jgi:serine/threonine-protein phosphatase 2A regulatory subunit B''
MLTSPILAELFELRSS